MKTDILIFPFSGTGIESLDCFGDEFNCVGFISDDLNQIGKSFHHIEIYDRSVINRTKNAKVLAVHGSPQSYLSREKVLSSLNLTSEQRCTVIHPTATISKYAKIGKNVLIMAGVSIGPEVVIEDNVIILPNTTIHHNSIIKEYTIICGNVLIAGDVTISKNCYIGAKTSIINKCQVGEHSMIGMGSNVIKDVHANSTSYGNPAKQID